MQFLEMELRSGSEVGEIPSKVVPCALVLPKAHIPHVSVRCCLELQQF